MFKEIRKQFRYLNMNKKRGCKQEIDSALALVVNDPLSLKNHFHLGKVYLKYGLFLPAHSQFRLCIALGYVSKEVLSAIKLSLDNLNYPDLASYYEEIITNDRNSNDLPPKPDLCEIDHNKFFRMRTIADHIDLRFGQQRRFSLLDVGGGDGLLSLFLPQADYVLVEPSVNGISAQSLPFPENSFDVVVSCHVFEHIPSKERFSFLDELCYRARNFVLLLNPFYIKDTFPIERMKLFSEVAEASWAREHLNCSLPSIEEVQEYARERRIGINSFPNGSITTASAMVFVNYFAQESGMIDQLKQVNRFFNTYFNSISTSMEYPIGYLVELTKNSGFKTGDR